MPDNCLSDTEVDELIKIVKGGFKERKRGPLTLWLFPYDREYNLNDQLKAIEELGKSRNKRALEFLLAVAEFEEKIEICVDRVLSSDGEHYHDRRIGCPYLVFPNANEPLYTALIVEQTHGDCYNLLMLTIKELREKANQQE